MHPTVLELLLAADRRVDALPDARHRAALRARRAQRIAEVRRSRRAAWRHTWRSVAARRPVGSAPACCPA